MRARAVTVGYLPQQPELDPDQSAFEAALAGQPRVAEIEAELEKVEASLGDPAVYLDSKALQRALASQQALLDEYAIAGW